MRLSSASIVAGLLPFCLWLLRLDGVACQVQVLNLPTLLHVIPAAMLHDALLVVWRNVGGYAQVFQLDLPGEDVDVLQQVFPLPLEAALNVCCFCSLALVAALQLLQFPLLLLHLLLLHMLQGLYCVLLHANPGQVLMICDMQVPGLY